MKLTSKSKHSLVEHLEEEYFDEDELDQPRNGFDHPQPHVNNHDE